MTAEQLLSQTPMDIVVQREVKPLTDQARALLPLSEMATVEPVLQSLVIQDADGERLAVEYLGKTVTWAKRVTEFWKPKKQFWNQVHAACCDAEKDTAPEIARIRTACEKALNAWKVLKQERAMRQQALLDQATTLERQKQQEAARIAALSGQVEKAEQIAKEAEQIRAPVIMTGPAKIAGAGERETFVPTCEDPLKLLKAVACGQVPYEFEIPVRGKGTQKVPLFVVNETVLKYFASKLGAQMDWPGVKVETDSKYAPRGL